MIRIVVGLVAGVLLLAGCTTPEPGHDSTRNADDLLATHDLDGLDGQEVVERLDLTPVAERPGDLLASVRPGEVVLADEDGAEVSLALPDDQFYVSIAPYVDRTHECFFHSLTTCLGELQNEEVTVQVINEADGTTLVDEELRTYDNGFVGLWLPRDIDATVTIEHDGRIATGPISTSDDAPTCLTTFRLT